MTMFGRSVDDDNFQDIRVNFKPTSPYGCAKVLGFNLVKHIKEMIEMIKSLVRKEFAYVIRITTKSSNLLKT